jgi:hypothetical protein
LYILSTPRRSPFSALLCASSTKYGFFLCRPPGRSDGEDAEVTGGAGASEERRDISDRAGEEKPTAEENILVLWNNLR